MGFCPHAAAGHASNSPEHPLFHGWMVLNLVRDLQQGMTARLAEVLRRRETLMAAAFPASATRAASSSTAALPVDLVRQLTVAEYRAAESQPAVPARPVLQQRTSHSTVASRQDASLALSTRIKQHRFLRAAPVDQGEPSVALLLLWEADHGKHFPCRTSDVAGQLNTSPGS